MKNILFFAYCLLPVVFAACNNADKTGGPVVADSAAAKPAADSSTAGYIHSFADTALENKITSALLKLPFIIKSNNYIDSFSNHTHGISFLLDNPAANETEISVQAGYNGKERFETYYHFYVDPKTLNIKVYDAVADKKLTVKEYLKTQH